MALASHQGVARPSSPEPQLSVTIIFGVSIFPRGDDRPGEVQGSGGFGGVFEFCFFGSTLTPEAQLDADPNAEPWESRSRARLRSLSCLRFGGGHRAQSLASGRKAH